MPQFAKKVLSQFLLTGCMRRLRFTLYPMKSEAPFPEERARQNMPEPLDPRPGFGELTRQGREWERDVYRGLVESFDERHIIISGEATEEDLKSGRCFRPLKLEAVVQGLQPGQFVVEPEFEVPSAFAHRFKLPELARDILEPRGDCLNFANVRPDLIQVTQRPARGIWYGLDGDGKRFAVTDDNRLGLRVVDIKLTATPSPSHFAEVALYSMVLADWLDEKGLSDRFFVDAAAAVWPGKHEGSKLALVERELKEKERRSPTFEEATAAVDEDLEVLPDDIFTARVRRFLLGDLRDVLQEPDWQTLDWHVGSGCIGCEYLGYQWSRKTIIDPRHCWQQAQREGHLCCVPGITVGARRSLKENGIANVAVLAAASPENPAFNKHHTLKASRMTLTHRAKALGTSAAGMVPRSATSASLPRWADLHVYLCVEFDRASGITIGFGWSAKIWSPAVEVNPEERKFVLYNNPRPSIIVEKRDLESERKFLLQWLESISTFVQDQDAAARAVQTAAGKQRITGATIQFYLWDEVSYEHLARVYARHLNDILAHPALGPLSWLFPSDKVLEDSRYQDGKSPLTIVQPMVKSSVAADIPHYYNLVQLASMYFPRGFSDPPNTYVDSYFLDPLSDHVPSERAHEIWGEVVTKKVHYQTITEKFRQTIKTKLRLLDNVTSRLAEDLPPDGRPEAPPTSVLLTKDGFSGVCWDGQIWYEFTSLNAAIARYKNEMLRALPPYEREAKFSSIRVIETITGADRREVLTRLNLSSHPAALVFRVSPRSTEAKIRTGKDYVSLMPEKSLYLATRTLSGLEASGLLSTGTLQNAGQAKYRTKLYEACEVKILHFDRQERLLVIEGSWYWDRNILQALVRDPALPFDFNLDKKSGVYAIVDPLAPDMFSKKVKEVVEAIGNPPLAVSQPLMADLPAHIRKAKRRVSDATPADRFLWDGARLAEEAVSVDLAVIEEVKAGLKHGLTAKQEEAFRKALAHKLFLLWGPPGTGKSETAAAILLGKVALARRARRPLRILLTGPTWVAIDNVCRKLPSLLEKLGYKEVNIILPYSSHDPAPPSGLDDVVREIAVPAKTENERYQALIDELRAPQGITVVATTSHQVPKLIKKLGITAKGGTRAELFDYILVDEASQVDVASSLLFLTGLAADASMTIVGDHLQMPPIHAANVPKDAEYIVGSLYDFYRQHYGVEPVMLDKNFRSNREIVDFIRNAGYEEELSAHHVTRRVFFPAGIPELTPEGWPAALPFGSVYRDILTPEKPLACLIHQDGQSAQSNHFEAQLTAALVRTLYGSLCSRLSERPDDIPSEGPYVGNDFFKNGVGIVTPHRAQQAEVIRLLEEIMPEEVDRQEIRNAVDTVERFQGQEKDVMIATFALGDPDAIAMEEEFIFGLERFNVIASRARAKFVLIVSKELVDHLPTDLEVMRSSKLLKLFVDGHLTNEAQIVVPQVKDGVTELKDCFLYS